MGFWKDIGVAFLFGGGLSTQRTLPYGSVEDVRLEALHLLEMGGKGGYVLSPSHSVEGDVSLDNMLAFIEVTRHRARHVA